MVEQHVDQSNSLKLTQERLKASGVPLGGFLSPFVVNARSLWGATPFDWSTRIQNADIDSDPNLNSGNGQITSAIPATSSSPGLNLIITIPGLPSGIGLAVICSFFQNVPIFVSWDDGQGNAGQVSPISSMEPSRFFFFTPPRPATAGKFALNINPLDANGKIAGDLQYCEVIPYQ